MALHIFGCEFGKGDTFRGCVNKQKLAFETTDSSQG